MKQYQNSEDPGLILIMADLPSVWGIKERHAYTIRKGEDDLWKITSSPDVDQITMSHHVFTGTLEECRIECKRHYDLKIMPILRSMDHG